MYPILKHEMRDERERKKKATRKEEARSSASHAASETAPNKVQKRCRKPPTLPSRRSSASASRRLCTGCALSVKEGSAPSC